MPSCYLTVLALIGALWGIALAALGRLTLGHTWAWISLALLGWSLICLARER